MNRKLIITKLNEYIVTSILEDEKVVEFHVTKNIQEQFVQLGNIYIGKVKNIVANINAAFIEIAPGVECYYSLQENPNPIFTNKIGKKALCIGDELLVQISKEAVKTKVPTVTSKLNFTGKYAVLTYGDTRAGASSKLSKQERDMLVSFAKQYTTEEFGIIMRTNAKNAEVHMLKVELEELVQMYHSTVTQATTRTCFTCLKHAQKDYLIDLRNIYQEGLTDIIIEDQSIYNEVKKYLSEEQPEDLDKLRMYQDHCLPLHKLYSIETQLENAQKTQVWLKSGAYIVIQPTEALTVIDVNTGKNISKKGDMEAYLKINKEAAKEIARQIRLRNLSGIILVDFINLSDVQYIDELLHYLQIELRKDPITTTLVDLTKLQLVEITRKKIRKPLHEIMGGTK